MDVRRRLVGLALCSVMLIAGIATVPGASRTRAEGTLTIDGQYESAGPLGPGEVRNLVVTGRGGVPATGVGAVALNVTVTDPTQSSFITAWPTGAPRPTSANLNFVPGQVVPNMVVVKVGDFGQVSFFNYAGTANLVVDVAGWFPADGFTGLTPARLADTRPGGPTIDNQFSGGGKVGAGGVFDLPVLNRGGVPATGVGAVALNVTAVKPSASSFLTVYPTGSTRPTSANLNYVPGDIVPNMVIVKVGDLGKVSMFNYAGDVDLVVDVMGWFPDTNSFNGLTPARLMDTRTGYPTIDTQFSGTGAITPNSTRDLVVVGRGNVPATGVGAVVLNVTATNPTAPSFLTVFPAGSDRPLAANLNFVAGQTVPNMVIAKVGADGKISIYNYGGNVDVVVDVMGWFPDGVAYHGLVPARLMDTRPGGNPTTPTLPTTTVPGAPTTTAPGGTTTTVPAPTTTAPPPPAPWTEQAVNMPVTPRNDTPYIARGGNQEVYDLEVIGNWAYVLGSFTDVRQTQGGATTGLSRLIRYNINTGQLDLSFAPVFDDEPLAMVRSTDGLSLFVVGRFNNVDSIQRRKIVKLDATTGAVDTNFSAGPAFGARATAVVASATTVYVGGQFSTVGGANHSGLVALDATTGAIDTSFTNQITGGIGVGGLLTVQEMLLSADGKLIVVHTGRQIDGQDRYGVGMIDTTNNTLLPWRTNLFQDNLSFVGGTIRVYAADIAPNQTYFVVTSGSGGDRPPISDVAIAFPTAGTSNVQPLWVSRHFDSVYSVAITDDYVFVGGHFSWEESPRSAQPWPGLATVGYGTGQGLGGYALGDQVARREQLGALSPTTGVTLEWSPWANGNEGVKALKATSRGLFVGVDATTVGTLNTGETAFFDLNTLPAPSPTLHAEIVSPYDGIVQQSGQPVTVEGTATASGGISSVQLDLRVRGSSAHLCAAGGTSTNCPYPTATLANPGATTSTWSIPITFGTTEYIMRARVLQVGGATSQWTQSTTEGFNFDDSAPTTAISLPAGGLVTTNTFVVTGTAQDDHGISAMNYVIYNPTTQLYIQDDLSAGPAYNSFAGVPDVAGVPNATWTFEMTVPNGDWELTATAIDNVGQADLRGATREWIVDPTGQSPTVTITSPVTWNPAVQPAPPAPPVTPPAATLTAVPGQQNLTFTGTANDDAAISGIDVSLRNLTTRENLAADGTWSSNVSAGFYRISQPNTATANWSFNVSSVVANLTPGIYSFRVRAVDNVQLSTTSYNIATVTLTVQYPGDAFPTNTINARPGGSPTSPDQGLEALHLDLTGTAADNAGVTDVRVTVNDLDTATYLTGSGGPMSTVYTVLPATLGTPNGTSTTWSLSVDLPAQGEYNITVQAVDTAGQFATTTSSWRYLIYPGDLDPAINTALNSPVTNNTATGPALSGLSISGRAEDDPNTGGITAVRLTIRQGTTTGNYFSTATGTFSSAAPSNINTFLTSPGSPGSNFSYATPLAANNQFTAGTYTITETPVDNWGQLGTPVSFTIALS